MAMMDERFSLAERLKQLADQAGSVSAFARMCGTPQRTMANYCEGSREPKATDLVMIARAARVNVGWLATGEGPMRPGEDAAPAAPAARATRAPERDPESATLRHVITRMEELRREGGWRPKPAEWADIVVATYRGALRDKEDGP